MLVGDNFIAVRHKIFALDVLFFNFRAGRKVHLRNRTIFRCDADKTVDYSSGKVLNMTLKLSVDRSRVVTVDIEGLQSLVNELDTLAISIKPQTLPLYL